MDGTYRILSLDGGGIRGVLTARVIERLVEKKPDLLDKFDMVAGTSTGAILACGLASGRGPREIIELYEQKGPSIFHTCQSTSLSRHSCSMTVSIQNQS